MENSLDKSSPITDHGENQIYLQIEFSQRRFTDNSVFNLQSNANINNTECIPNRWLRFDAN